MPTPTMSPDHHDHYITLLEYLANLEEMGNVTEIDSGFSDTVEMCANGCKHVMFSDVGRRRHNWLVHRV